MQNKYKVIRKDNYIALSSFNKSGDRKGPSIELYLDKTCKIGEFINDELNGYGAIFTPTTIHLGKMKKNKKDGLCFRYAYVDRTYQFTFGFHDEDKLETGFIIDITGDFCFRSKCHKDFRIDFKKENDYGQFSLYNYVTKKAEETVNYVKFDSKSLKKPIAYDYSFKDKIKLEMLETDSYIYEGEVTDNKEDGCGIRYHLDDYEVMLKDDKGITKPFMQRTKDKLIYNLGVCQFILYPNEPQKAMLVFRNSYFSIDGAKFDAYFNQENQLPSTGFSKKHPYYRMTFTKDLQILIDDMLDDEIVKMGVYNIKFISVYPEKPIEYQWDLNAEKNLDNLIGLKNVKKKVNRIKSYVIKNRNNNVNLHMAFLGNPGTGKTEVAKLLNDIFFKYGILPTPKLINTDRSGLVGGHIGETAIKTREIIEKAMGGVLFIDEAYALYNSSQKDFGNEAIVELLKQMEDHKGEFCCILAGYKNDMYKLFDMNPGFKSRIQYIIDFEDFTSEELEEIAKIFINKNKTEVDAEILAKLMSILKYQKENLPHFGNARDVRNLIEQVSMIAASRDGYDGRILMEDIAVYMKENTITERRIARVRKPNFESLTNIYQKNYKEKHFKEGKYDVYESHIQIYNNYDDSTIRKTGFIFSPDGYAITIDLNVNECVNADAVRHVFDRKGNIVKATNSVSVADERDGISVIKLDNAGGKYSYLPMLNVDLKDYLNQRLIVIGTSMDDNSEDIIKEFEGYYAYITNINNDGTFEFKLSKEVNFMDGSLVITEDTCKILGVLKGKNTAISINKIIELLK